MSAIEDAARELSATILEHARQCAEDPSDAASVVQLVERVHRAARDYGDALFTESGWSNPLNNIDAEIPDGDEPDDTSGEGADGGQQAPPGRTWISVAETHALYVNDPDAVIELARKRTGREPESLEDAVLALCAEDGWKPQAYPGNIIELDWRSSGASYD